MSNHTGELALKVLIIDKGKVNEKSLVDIFELDEDLRADLSIMHPVHIKKRFKNDAERLSAIKI